MRLVPGKVLWDELTKSTLRMILGVVELWHFFVSYVVGKGLESATSSRAIVIEPSQHRLFRISLALGVDLPDLTFVVHFFA